MKLFAIACVLLLLVGCGSAPQPTPIPLALAPTPRPVLVDTDMAVDDMLALLYLLSRPDIDVKAITLSGTGIARCPAAARNLQALLEALERTNVPYACGRETPLEGDHAFAKEWRDQADTFFGLGLTPKNAVSPKGNAVQLLTETLDTSGGKITIFADGPLTNLAEAFQAQPALGEKIEMLYIMGGAVHVPGNMSEDMHTEGNFYADPAAAAHVFGTAVPITLVPLDATNSVPATRQSAEHLGAQQQTVAAKFAKRLVDSLGGELDSGGYYFWDTLTSVVLTDESFTTIQDKNIAVAATSGQTTETPSGKRIRVATSANPMRFEQIFIQTLNGQFK